MQLNFQRQGAGAPLVILHGLFGSLDNWHSLSRQWGGRYNVFALDLRNHGRSPHSDEFNYRVIADDLLEFMASQRLERAHFLGHSLGGKAAMHFALANPERVEKLVVVDIAPRQYPPSHVPLFEAMLALDPGAFRERNEMDRALAARIPDATVRQFLLKNVARDESGAFRWKLNLPAIYRNYEQLNEAIEPGRTFNGPTLFIRGGKSDYIRDEDHGLIAQIFPNSRVATVPTAGHWVNANAPGELSALVWDFLG
jgi:esterase